MAYIVMAYMVHGLYGNGLYGVGLYGVGLYSVGLYSYGVYSYGTVAEGCDPGTIVLEHIAIPGFDDVPACVRACVRACMWRACACMRTSTCPLCPRGACPASDVNITPAA